MGISVCLNRNPMELDFGYSMGSKFVKKVFWRTAGPRCLWWALWPMGLLFLEVLIFSLHWSCIRLSALDYYKLKFKKKIFHLVKFWCNNSTLRSSGAIKLMFEWITTLIHQRILLFLWRAHIDFARLFIQVIV